jgi:MFS family permease
MLLVEIPLVALSGASLARLGARGLLGMGVVAGGIRWAVCGFMPESPLVYPLQALHGVVVAGLVIGAPLYVEAAVPERLRSTGQGLLAMVGVSLGGIVSNIGCGWLLEHYGPDAPYAISGLAALALGALLPILLPRPSRPAEP